MRCRAAQQCPWCCGRSYDEGDTRAARSGCRWWHRSSCANRYPLAPRRRAPTRRHDRLLSNQTMLEQEPMVDGQGGRSDTVSPELRAAESELDRAYRSNPLMSATFGEAAWYFLAGCEDFYVREVVRAATGKGSTSHDLSLMSDNIVNHAKWPLRWFRNECLGGTATPKGYNDASYAAAAALSDLSFKYLFVDSAFTYASLGLFPLTLQGNRIVMFEPSNPLNQGWLASESSRSAPSNPW